jgi:hypothetical protein
MLRVSHATGIASSLALMAVCIDVNFRPLHANVHVREASVIPWPTPAQTVPAPVPASSAPLLSQRSAFGVGSTVDVFWNGKWYPATVRAVRGPGQWLITYIGYSSAWDEVVGSDRIRRHQGQAAPSSPNPGNSGGYPSAPSCGFGSTCGAVPMSPNPTGLFGTGTW